MNLRIAPAVTFDEYFGLVFDQTHKARNFISFQISSQFSISHRLPLSSAVGMLALSKEIRVQIGREDSLEVDSRHHGGRGAIHQKTSQ